MNSETKNQTPPKSQRVLNSTNSIIGDLLKLAGQADIISFAGGLPSPKSFPIKEVEKATQTVLEKEGALALQYSSTVGEKPLIDQIVKYINSKGVPAQADEIQIVSGSQQALDLLGMAYIDKGSLVAVESPSYLGAIQAFDLYEPKYIEIPTDEHGLNPDLIGPEFKNIRFAYVITTFQNPTGLTLSVERRKKLAEKAREYDFWIIDDNPYGELYYDQEPPPSMRLYAPERTISLGTFSKVLAPGFRLGYVVGPKEAIAPLTQLKQAVDLNTSTFTQLITAQIMEDGLMTTHLPAVREIYKTQCEYMLKAMDQYFPKEGVTWTKPDGGMFIWVTLPESINTDELMKEAVARKVAFVPGSAFYTVGQEKYNSMRLSFVTVPPAKIEEGIKTLGELLKEKLGQ
ncbi:MAG: PLP-dependent aminotransferase family protein [Burkholderiales bacterium]|nr:PLP-dependent aminotransferase family protein [Burkholderiales bacterium]